MAKNNEGAGACRRRTLVALLGALAPLASRAQAPEWPTKPLRIVVPYAPGAINDVLARHLAERLQVLLGQPVIVENRAGGGAVIGTQAVASAPADGYTLLQVPAAHANNATLVPRLPYDPVHSFSFITLAARAPLLLVAGDHVAVRNVAELLTLARKKPGAHTYASSGNGGAAHLMGEMLKQMAGIDLLHVPYKGAAPAMTDVAGGRVDLTFATYTVAAPSLKAGRARILAVTGAKRWQIMPEVPTMAESGVPGYAASAWWGYAAPAGTPPIIIERLNREINNARAAPALRAALAAEGIEPVGTTPAEFSAFIRSEIPLWAGIIRKANIRLE